MFSVTVQPADFLRTNRSRIRAVTIKNRESCETPEIIKQYHAIAFFLHLTVAKWYTDFQDDINRLYG